MPTRRLAAIATASALLLAAPGLAADPPKPPDLPVESYRLPNGLKVVLSRDPSVPRVTVAVAYHVGSKNERAGRTGFAHFFEHMMFRGTENVPNYDVPLQEAGAQSNAFTSEDMTVYFETVPAEFLERALYLESERLAFLPSALDREKFDTEREVVKNERRQSIDNVPYGLSVEAILSAVFPEGHPYSWSVIGSMADLDAASLDDLRRFFAEFYHPGNATLTLVGDFDPAATKPLIEKYFGPLAPGKEPGAVEAPPAPAASKRVELADRVTEPRLELAWPTVDDDHPDAPALDLLAAVLSGGPASRLDVAMVREARAATGVSADHDTREIAGLFRIQATAAEGHTVDELERLIDAELEKIRAEEPEAAELERSLALLEKSVYAGLTAPLARAIVLSIGMAQKGDPLDFQKQLERTFAVTPADVKRVANAYLKPERVALVIRPVRDGEEKTPVAAAGPKPTDEPEPAPEPRAPKPGPDWSAMPGPSEPRDFKPPAFARRTLSNGIDLWVAPWTTLPLVEARLIVPVGTADDPEGKAGLAELLGSLLDQGTAEKTATELTEAFEQLGVTPGVGVGPDDTQVSISTVSRNLRPALGLLAEMLARPRFDPADFEREKALQLAALARGPDNPQWLARRALRVLLFGQDHPYGTPPDGTPESVAGLSLDDVRAFHREFVAPAGAILVVVGDVEPDALVADLEATLGRWKAEGKKPGDRPASTVRAEPGVVYLVDKPGAVQSVISVGRRWADRADPRYEATLLGNRVLGGDFLSRLNQNLRERNGFSYGAGSVFDFRRTGSVWVVNTSVRADATAPALKEILGELEGLAEGGDRPFDAEEVEIARGAEALGFPESFESPSGIAGVLAEIARFGLPADHLDTFLDRLEAAEPGAIARAMAEVVAPGDRVVLVVGDRATVEPALKALGFGTIRVIGVDGRPAAAR